jgi:hypothetical protein
MEPWNEYIVEMWSRQMKEFLRPRAVFNSSSLSTRKLIGNQKGGVVFHSISFCRGGVVCYSFTVSRIKGGIIMSLSII